MSRTSLIAKNIPISNKVNDGNVAPLTPRKIIYIAIPIPNKLNNM